MGISNTWWPLSDATRGAPQGTGAWNALFAGEKLWAVADPELTAAELGAEDTADTDPVGRWFCDELPRLLAAGHAQVRQRRFLQIVAAVS